MLYVPGPILFLVGCEIKKASKFLSAWNTSNDI